MISTPRNCAADWRYYFQLWCERKPLYYQDKTSNKKQRAISPCSIVDAVAATYDFVQTIRPYIDDMNDQFQYLTV